MKNRNQLKVTAKNGSSGLDIYLNISGTVHYVTTRRPNGMLWLKLKDGITLGELKRAKPKNSPAGQKLYQRSQYLLKVMDEFIQNEFAA